MNVSDPLLIARHDLANEFYLSIHWLLFGIFQCALKIRSIFSCIIHHIIYLAYFTSVHS